MTRELFQQALDALEGAAEYTPLLDAIKAWSMRPLAQPVQPMAWLTEHEDGDMVWLDKKEASGYSDEGGPIPLYTVQPVQPHNIEEREWVTLTEEDVIDAETRGYRAYTHYKASIRGQHLTPADSPSWHFAQEIEAKLKEMNT